MAGQQNKKDVNMDDLYKQLMEKVNAQAEEIITKAQQKANEIIEKAAKEEKVLTAEEEKYAEEMKQLVRVRLPRIKDKGDVFVAVNGRAFLIKRGETVEVPMYIAKALEDSEEQENVAYDLIEKLSGRYEDKKENLI